jgi:hypothetical protein
MKLFDLMTVCAATIETIVPVTFYEIINNLRIEERASLNRLFLHAPCPMRFLLKFALSLSLFALVMKRIFVI